MYEPELGFSLHLFMYISMLHSISFNTHVNLFDSRARNPCFKNPRSFLLPFINIYMDKKNKIATKKGELRNKNSP